MRHVFTCLLLSLCTSVSHAQSEAWNFRVLLDDKPIGTHRFELDSHNDGGRKTLRSTADFRITLLGIPVYRYHHQAVEHWQADCLRGIQASTQDGGDSLSVALQEKDLPGCIMSYAYWNPRLREQQRLLNAQTGKLDAVQVTRIGASVIEAKGQMVNATQWRITGLKNPIDLWYGPDTQDKDAQPTTANWLGLDSTVSGGRRLRYRLE